MINMPTFYMEHGQLLILSPQKLAGSLIVGMYMSQLLGSVPTFRAHASF